MPNLVVDSSVAIKWVVVEPLTTPAAAILTAYQTGALTLIAPDLIYAELGNIVWKKHTMQGLTADDAERIVDDIGAMPLIVTPATALLAAAYRLAVAHGRTVYDALYLALSLREGCPFVTADERLVNSVRAALPQVVWLGHWTPPGPATPPAGR
jgi:predicted nucleic acid-binding protein